MDKLLNKPNIDDTSTEGVYIGNDGIAIGKDNLKVTSAGYIKADTWEYFDNILKNEEHLSNHDRLFTVSPNSIVINETNVNDEFIKVKNLQQITPQTIASTKPQKLLYCTSNEAIQFVKELDLIADGTNAELFDAQNIFLHYNLTNCNWPVDAIKICTKEELFGNQLAKTSKLKIYGGIFIPITNQTNSTGIVGVINNNYLIFKNTSKSTITEGNIFVFGHVDHKFK